MPFPIRSRAALILLLFAAACTAVPKAEPPVAQPQPPPSYSVEGLEDVMGANVRALERQFGRPQLDVSEGEARKLQFANDICVLDAYLYPPRPGAEAVVTHVDTRLPDGRSAERVSCARVLFETRSQR